MKKIIFIILCCLFLMGCTSPTPEKPDNGNNPNEGGEEVTTPKEKVKIVVPQGNPFIAVGNLIGEENISIENVNGAAGVKTALVDKSADIVIAPLNLGAQLYVKGNSNYKLDSVIALGNTYIISKSDKKLDNIQDLNGKKILAYSQGGTPDIILKHVLTENKVSDYEIEYQTSLTEVVPFFIQGHYDYILAAEPVITNLKVKKGLSLNVLNLQEYTESTIMQAAIFVKPSSENQESIDVVIKKIKENISSMNQNPEKYAEEIVQKGEVYFTDLGKDIIAQSIPNANLSFVNAKENKNQVEQYLDMIGYEKPEASFYR